MDKIKELVLKIENNLGPINQTCIICGKALTYKQIKRKSYKSQYTGPNLICGDLLCRAQKNKLTCLERYNVTNAAKLEQSKRKQVLTQIVRYGGITGYCKNNNREKIRKRIQSEKELQKQNRINLSKNIPINISDITDPKILSVYKSNMTRNLNANIILNFKSYVGKDFINDDEFIFLLDIIGYKNKSSLYKVLRENNIKLINDSSINFYEKEIYCFCKSKTQCNIIQHSRTVLKDFEFDLYIPELKFAIEFNGDYWHQIECINKKNKNYHLNKTELAESKGIRLIHIWESEWKTNKEYCKYVIEQYLNGNIPDDTRYNNKLPRDYFQVLDFPKYIIKEPDLERSGSYKVYKQGYLCFQAQNN